MAFSPDLHLVESLADAQDFLRWNYMFPDWIALDTETIGLEWWKPNFTRTVQFGTEADGWVLEVAEWRGVIRDALLVHPARKYFMHNAKFDLHALESAGLPDVSLTTHDTMIMSWLVNPLAPNGLKSISKRYVDNHAQIGEQLLKKEMRQNGYDWSNIPISTPAYWSYAALDTCLTFQLGVDLQKEIVALELQEPYEMEMAVMRILRQAERRGAKLDLDYTRQLSEQWADEALKLRFELQQAGIENPSANRQIEEALRLEGWEPDEFTATGQAKLDSRVLKGLDSDTANNILQYKKLTKWNNTYLKTFLEDNDEGVLHANIRTLAAKTGRMSIQAPALQTLPRGPEIRNCIVPSAGCSIWACDYSQIELRVFASMANEIEMINAFLAGEDLHSATAELFYGPEFTPAQRSICKNGNFSVLYGAGAKKLAETAGVSEQEAHGFLTAYKLRYQAASAFIKHVEDVARQRLIDSDRAYIIASDGRRLYANEQKLYQLVNYLVQGSAAVVLKEAIIRIDNAGLSEFIILPVHDELLFNIPDQYADLIVPQLQDLMEDKTSFQVPLTVSMKGPFQSWGAAYE